MLYGRRYKFKINEAKVSELEERQRNIALYFAATPACIIAYYIFGAGASMLIIALLAYIVARVMLMRKHPLR